jgi:hypothetical protein
MRLLRHLLGRPDPKPYPQMTAPRVSFSFRVFWTKIALGWSAEKRDQVRQQVVAYVQQDDFDANLVEKRHHFPIEGLPEAWHSGASLLALIDVLDALEAEDNTPHEQ